MKSDPFDGITSPSVPTLSDIQRRMAEITAFQQKLESQTQLQNRPAPPKPPPPTASPSPTLGDAALYGVAGLAYAAHLIGCLAKLLPEPGNAISVVPRSSRDCN